MTEPRRDTKWWGWGDAGTSHPISEAGRAELSERFGDPTPASRVVAADVAIPEPRELPGAVIAAVGPEGVYTGREDRLRHALGKSYSDLLAARGGTVAHGPDAVLVPGDREAVSALVSACSENGVAVVPFGGGTSVVGGVTALTGEHDRVVALDTVALREVEVDHTSMTARLGAGLRGPEAEAALRARGVSLSHYPQSYDYATIGGYAATRSAGQASTGVGRFDKLVCSIGMATPVGRITTLETPHSAAGPALRELIVGSEGTLGVIDDVTVRVIAAPAESRYEAWFLPGFEDGVDAFRELAQNDAAPDVLRLSDPEETRIGLTLSGPTGWQRRALGAYLKARKVEGGCFVLTGWEGSAERVKHRRKRAAAILRRAGAAGLGTAGVGSWERTRFEGPYLRDELMDLGVFVDTLETSHTWTRLLDLYGAVRHAIDRALSARGTPPIVLCHISHVYRDGASLYFTLMARSQTGNELEQWQAAKRAASEAIAATGGTITHHHAIGTDHAPYMGAEIGPVGVEALQALKERLDPNSVMNPGKLIPPPPG